MKSPTRVLISAAERSGDMHAANLVRCIREQRPDIAFHGFGGELLADAGCRVDEDLIRLASMGFSFLGHVHRYVGIARRFDRLLREERPAAVLLVDSPGLNFIFARLARWRGVPVVYYICPQIWGWGAWRRAKVLRYTDLLLAILPFEKRLYENPRVPVKYVGHPLADDLALVSPGVGERLRERLGVAAGEPVIGVLPGSRTHEVEDLLPLLRSILEAMELPRRTCVVFSAFRAEFVPRIEQAMRGSPLRVEVEPRDSRAIAAASDLVLVASGTASLEVAYFGTPMVVVYPVGLFGRWFVKNQLVAPFFSLPNILGVSLFGGEPLVPERVCKGTEAREIAVQAAALLGDGPLRRQTLDRLRQLRETFLRPGASQTAAAELIAFVDDL